MHKNELTGEGYVILKKNLTPEKLLQIKNDLTVKPKVNTDYADEPESFTVFKETDDNIIVPRYYGIKRLGIPNDNLVITDSLKVDFEFNGKLRDTQPEVAKVALDKIKNRGGGILQLHTGYGKTTLALYLASQLKLKTLIIVHKTFLQDQWYDRIKQFTNASIGMIRQKKVDIEGKDIVIGMLQSVSMIAYDPEIFKQFGLCIFDEVHRTSSRVFSRAFLKLSPKYTIGLSATPIRQDGLTKVINWFVGDILIKAERKGDNAVYVKCFDYKSNNELFAEKKRWFKGKANPDTVKMITNMYKITQRNTFIVNVINALRLNTDRKILVLSGRIVHLKMLKEAMDVYIKNDIKEGKYNEDEFKTAYYVGGMKDYELKDASESDIIFATYDMAEEGLDIDGLNTLVLATPKKKIIQAIGRIMRKPIEEGDINPLIIDIADQVSCFESWADQRVKYYKSKKYTLDIFKAHNDKVIPFKEHMLMAGMIDLSTYKGNLELDIRKEYILQKYGINTYNFELRAKFYNFPDKMFNYSCKYEDILKINHDYSITTQEKKTEIDYNPNSSLYVET